MNEPDTAANESDRLKALYDFNILDTLPEKRFDDFAVLAALICGTPVAMISFVVENREWIKASYGLKVSEFPLESSLALHTIRANNGYLILPDARLDGRFTNNPLVKNAANCLFYAGVPLVTSDGFALGALGVIGHEPITLEEAQMKALATLAGVVVQYMEERQKAAQFERRYLKIVQLAGKAAHDLKSPLSSIVLMTELFREQYGGQLEEEAVELLISINEATYQLAHNIDDILDKKLKEEL